MDERLERRKLEFKSSLDTNDSRRKREDESFSLRKKNRDEQYAKRRFQSDQAGTPVNPFSQDTDDTVLARCVQQLTSNDVDAKLKAVVSLREMTCREYQPPIGKIIASGCVPLVVQTLQIPNEKIHYEATWFFTNMATGETQHVQVVVASGCVPYFFHMLQTQKEEYVNQAAWALGNIAGDCIPFRDQLLAAGALHLLLPYCRPQVNVTLLRTIVWTISNMFRGKPHVPVDFVRMALPPLTQVLTVCLDQEVLTDICWAISYASDEEKNEGRIQAVIAAGAVPKLVELLESKHPSIQTPALRAIGNVVTGDDLETQVALSNQVVPRLVKLLQHEKTNIKREACWTLSNIMAGNCDQIQHVLDANAVPIIIEMIRNAPSIVKLEAAWSISNACTNGTPAQIRYLVEQGSVPVMCELLAQQNTKLITLAMEAIHRMLKVGQHSADERGENNKICVFVEQCGGFDKLEHLQQHDHDYIRGLAMRLIAEYWPKAVDEDFFAPREIDYDSQ